MGALNNAGGYLLLALTAALLGLWLFVTLVEALREPAAKTGEATDKKRRPWRMGASDRAEKGAA